MDVQVQRSFVVPSVQTEPSTKVPLTVFDLIAPASHLTVLYAFSPPNPSNAALVDALTATLPRFPLLTARLDRSAAGRRPLFVTGRGGAGALVIEAAVSSALSHHLPLVPSTPGLELLHVPADAVTAAPQLLQLQINRFACGGLVIATSAHHQAADGYSMSTFFHAWARAVRGEDDDEDRCPVPFGPAALAPRCPPRCEFEHRGIQFMPAGSPPPPPPHKQEETPPPAPERRVDPSEIANTLLHYSSEFVGRLKAGVGNRYTTFETVSAHLWRKITAARGRAATNDGAAEDDTSFYVSVNGRPRLLGTGALPKPDARGGFFGNVVLTARAGPVNGKDLARGSLADAAELVRVGVRAVDRTYFQSFIDFGALHSGDEELEPSPTVGDEDNVLTPDVAADSWTHLEFHKLDLGCGGRLAGILPAKLQLDGLVVLMPSLREGGGVDVLVALYEKHAKELMDIAYTMEG